MPSGERVGHSLILIERYIFRRTLGLTVASLGLVTMIVLTTQSLLYINILTQSGQSLLTFLKLALTLVPAMVMIVMPFALLLGAANTLNRMNGDSELSVLEAAGAGKKILVRPILTIAAAATVISLAISLFVDPWSSAIRHELRVAAGADLIGIAIQSGSFRRIDENLYVQIAEQYSGGTLGGIFIADRRDPDVELIYYAQTGRLTRIDDRTLIMMNGGEIHRRNLETGDVSIISFVSYAIDMSRFGPARSLTRFGPGDWSTAELLDPDPNNEFARNRPEEIRAEFHKRFSEWLYPPAFALIAIFFVGAARPNREERVWGMMVVFSAAFLLRGAGFVATNSSGISLAAAVACYALPLGAIAALAVLLAYGRSLVVPLAVIERTDAILEWLAGQGRRLQLAMAGYRARRNAGRPM